MSRRIQLLTLLPALALAGAVGRVYADDVAGRLEIAPKPQSPGHSRTEFEVHWRSGVSRVTALQFDVRCAPGWRAVVGAGQRAEYMGKTVAIGELAAKRTRVLVFSVDSLQLADGELAVITVVPEIERPESLWIEVDGIVAVDQSATPVSLSALRFVDARPGRLQPVQIGSSGVGVAAPVYATAACGYDVNRDGVIDIADIQMLAVMAEGTVDYRCDLDGDGLVTKADSDLVLRAVFGSRPGVAEGGAEKAVNPVQK